jgi:hypothetical protein
MSDPTLPEGWTREEIGCYGVVIEWPGHGAVTVSEKARSFELGMAPPSRRGNYAGRRWKDRLYADAIKALQDVFAAEKRAA